MGYVAGRLVRICLSKLATPVLNAAEAEESQFVIPAKFTLSAAEREPESRKNNHRAAIPQFFALHFSPLLSPMPKKGPRCKSVKVESQPKLLFLCADK